MGADRIKSYIAVVVDAEGEKYEYVAFARNRRTARREVRASAENWGAEVVAIQPMINRKTARRRLELLLVGLTLGLSILAITATILFESSLELL